jgi:hypothetical protein
MMAEGCLFFGSVKIAGKVCSSRGCGGEPVAKMPWRTREDGTDVVWACAEHAQRVAAWRRGFPVCRQS